MKFLSDAVREEIESGAHLEDLVLLVHNFNQRISQEVSSLGLKIQTSPFVPFEEAYLLNVERCNKALAWSLGYKKERTSEKVSSRNLVLSHVQFGALRSEDR